MADNNANQISDKIKDKYEVVGIIPGIINIPHLGAFDLRKIDMETADMIFKSKKCTYLKEIAKKKGA
jgi:hypothetical protein